MTPAPSSRLLRPCPDWGPRLGPTPTHGWCEADLLEQGGEGKPQASIRVAEDTAAGCGHWLQAESWACLPWQRAGDAVTASLTADRATLSVRGYEKGLEDLASGRIRGRIGHFCGLDSVFILKCPCFDIRYDCGMVLFLSWSTMVTLWPYLMFPEIAMFNSRYYGLAVGTRPISSFNFVTQTHLW